MKQIAHKLSIRLYGKGTRSVASRDRLVLGKAGTGVLTTRILQPPDVCMLARSDRQVKFFRGDQS